jgi:stage V sporulation protein B
MGMKGYKDAVVSSLQGVFNTQYNPLINLPVAVAAAMAVAAIPSIVLSSIQNRTSEVIDKTRAVIKLNMVIAFPSAIGLSVLSKPIIMLLFPKLVTYQVLAINLLLTGSSAVIFYSLSTITTAILQVNNYMRIPMFNSGISLAIHVVLVYALLTFTNLHVYALIIGNVTFSLIVCVLNCRSVSMHLQYKWEYRKTFVVPFVSSMLMGIVTYGSYKIFLFLLHSNSISLIISIILSIIVYFALILKLKCFFKQELLDLPMGDKIIKIAK